VAQLPAPIVPFFIGDIGKSRGALGRERQIHFFAPGYQYPSKIIEEPHFENV